MKARIKLVEGMTFVGESGSGHGMVIDGAPDYGGRNLGPRPMELLLLGMGSCTAFDVVLILRKGREAVEDCIVEVEAERAATDPKVFTHIRVRYVVSGRNLRRSAVERAVALSAEKYCSASVMLGKTASIEHVVEIVDTAAPAAAHAG